jgi:hypothetical protein
MEPRASKLPREPKQLSIYGSLADAKERVHSKVTTIWKWVNPWASTVSFYCDVNGYCEPPHYMIW